MEALFEDVLLLEREKFWRPAAAASGLDPQHIEKEERVLALATMVGGAPIVALMQAEDGLLPQWERDRHPKLFKAMSACTHQMVRPLEPDLVGEFFVLTVLDANHKEEDAMATQLAAFAWRHAPFAAAVFVDRCAQAYVDPPPEGSRLHADYPANGVLIPRRNTLPCRARK